MKKLPQKKKKLGGLLTQSSQSIITAGLIGGVVLGNMGYVESVSAGHSSAHSNANVVTRDTAPVLPFPAPVNNTRQYGPTFTLDGPGSCNHASGIVNGHFSQTPTVNPSAFRVTTQTTHSNVNTHSSGSSGWCW